MSLSKSIHRLNLRGCRVVSRFIFVRTDKHIHTERGRGTDGRTDGGRERVDEGVAANDIHVSSSPSFLLDFD